MSRETMPRLITKSFNAKCMDDRSPHWRHLNEGAESGADSPSQGCCNATCSSRRHVGQKPKPPGNAEWACPIRSSPVPPQHRSVPSKQNQPAHLVSAATPEQVGYPIQPVRRWRIADASRLLLVIRFVPNARRREKRASSRRCRHTEFA
jgi:hypothetical protein